jgi:hypothetical protein
MRRLNRSASLAITHNYAYLTAMHGRLALAAGLALALIAAPAAAQIIPTPPALENRIPAPLPPPPQPPIVNGPFGQSPPPGVYVPPRLNTQSDRVIGCQPQRWAARQAAPGLHTRMRERELAHHDTM